MEFDSTWEIGVLLDYYADKRKPLETEEFDYEKYEQKEALQKLYAKAIELTCKKGCGFKMPIDDFITDVEGGTFIDYDGIGYLLDKDGEEIGGMHCNVSFLKKAKENGACFIDWYNK